MAASYLGWLSWAAAYEPTAFTGFAGNQISNDSYNEAVDMVTGLSLPANTLLILTYKLAMHNFILQSNLMAAPINTLYTKYSVESNLGLGIIQSASDSGTASARVIPDAVQRGDMATMLLWSTPYGKWCESIFEQLGAVFAVVVE